MPPVHFPRPWRHSHVVQRPRFSLLRLDGCRHLAVDRERRQLRHMQDAVRRQLSGLQDPRRWLSARYIWDIYSFSAKIKRCFLTFLIFLTRVKLFIKKKKGKFTLKVSRMISHDVTSSRNTYICVFVLLPKNFVYSLKRELLRRKTFFLIQSDKLCSWKFLKISD